MLFFMPAYFIESELDGYDGTDSYYTRLGFDITYRCFPEIYAELFLMAAEASYRDMELAALNGIASELSIDLFDFDQF